MRRLLKTLRRLFVLALLAGAVFLASRTLMPRAPLAAREGPTLTAARTWGYQLQNARPDRIAAGIDLLVIDAQSQSVSLRGLSVETVERFRTRPDGQRRTVLAYLSIGEAESYRAYWWSHWAVLPPPWLGPENKQWKGNYRVRYWDPDWQRLIFDQQPSMLTRAIDLAWPQRRPYIDQIIEAGFDGVYLDRVDAYYEWQTSRPDAEASMTAFVGSISAYAKARRPGFLVVPQNAEELLNDAGYRRRIDGIAKEDLLFGADHKDNDNKPADVSASVRYLNMAKAARLPVFVVEYLGPGDKRQRAAARLHSLGFIPQFADRALKQPPELPLTEPAASPAATPPSLAVRPKG